MSGTGKASLRARLAPLLGGRATDFVATQLLREGSALWSSDPHRVQEAIDKVEQAWALTRDPEIAIQLATMYDRANRNDDALVVLRQAFRRNPDHALLRHHAAITLLRHGAPDDIRDFFESVLKVDAQDAFARFVMTLLDRYDGWVAQLASSIERKRDGRQPFVISLPVWGETHSAYCERFFCASLLSPNNLPALARSHSIHIAVFTTAESEQALRAKPLFCRLEEHATVDFIHYPAELVDYRAAMQACYGDEKVHYSENSLAFYYERNCKFALMSCAHYVALAAGRATDAFVSCLVADLALNDGALLAMADRMSNADAVLAHAIQMHGKVRAASPRAALPRGRRHPATVAGQLREACHRAHPHRQPRRCRAVNRSAAANCLASWRRRLAYPWQPLPPVPSSAKSVRSSLAVVDRSRR